MVLNDYVDSLFSDDSSYHDNDDDTITTLNSNQTGTTTLNSNQIQSLAAHIKKQGTLLDILHKKKNDLEQKNNDLRDQALQLAMEVNVLREKVADRDARIRLMSTTYLEAKELLIEKCIDTIVHQKLNKN